MRRAILYLAAVSAAILAPLAFPTPCEGAQVQIQCSWDPVTTDILGNTITVTGYRLYMATSQAGLATAPVHREISTTVDTFYVECGPTYWFAVTAYTETEESEKSASVSVDCACPHHAPKPPSGVSAQIIPETPPPPPPPTTPVLSESFAATTLPAGWEAIDDGSVSGPSIWSISAGTLRQSSGINDGGTGTSLQMLGSRYQFGGGQWYDFMLRAKINGKGGNVLGIVFRASNLNYYRFLESRISKFRRLQRVEAGSVVTLASDTMATFPENVWQAVEILVQGGRIVVTIDGVQVFDVTDPTPLPAGTVGCYTWSNAYAYFDDFIIELK